MQKNSNRKGLALGAVFALVASLFATTPANAAAVDGNEIGAYPVAGTTLTGTVYEDFPTYVELKQSAKAAGSSLFVDDNLVFRVTKTAGTNMDVVFAADDAVTSIQNATSSITQVNTVGQDNVGVIRAGSTSGTVSAHVANGIAHLNFKASSSSPESSWSAVTLQVVAWLDTQGGARNDVIDTDEWRTTFTVSLVAASSITAPLTVTDPNEGDTLVTASATVGGVNLANLSGRFFLQVDTYSLTDDITRSLTSADLDVLGGVVSKSYTVTALRAADTLSVEVRYTTGSAAIDGGIKLGTAYSKNAAAKTVGTLKTDVVDSDNSYSTSATAAKVRPNQTYTVRVHASTGSTTVSSLSGVAVTVKFAGSQALSAGSKTISVNGAAATTSYPASLTVTTGADGYATFTIATTGFENGNVIKVQANVGNTVASEYTLTAETVAYSIVNDFDNYVTAPGTGVVIGYSVEDQYGVASPRADQRLQITRGGTGFAFAETVSTVAVVAGKASFTFTPEPATKTGSASVSAVLQQLNVDENRWATVGTADVFIKINVTSDAAAFTKSSTLKASYSSSVSYFANTVSWTVVEGSVNNAGAEVEISGAANLVFREFSKTATASGKLVLRSSDAGVFKYEVASLLAGSHTISMKVGTAVTTSLLVVDAASYSAGVKIAFDKSTINSGVSSAITGTLTDANGNPVETDGSAAKVTVTWTGVGYAFSGTGTSVVTDEDGKFTVNVLVLPGESGPAVLTATYMPAGSATAKNNVTVAAPITVAAPAAPAAPEINAVIGTFNGRWAVRVENAKGAVVAVKVGGNWFKYTSLNENYLFSRKSVKGRSVAVAVYVNGTLENVATITIK